MKFYLTILAFALLASINAFGQKINFYSTTIQQEAGVYTKITCTLSELDSASQGMLLRDKFRINSEILKADIINFRDDKADICLILYPKNSIETIQNLLLKMDIPKIYWDRKKIQSNQLLDHYNRLTKHE